MRALEEYPQGVKEYASRVVRRGGKRSDMPMVEDNVIPSLEDVSGLESGINLERNGARASGESWLMRISIVQSCVCDFSTSDLGILCSSIVCGASPFSGRTLGTVTGELGTLSVLPSVSGLVIYSNQWSPLTLPTVYAEPFLKIPSRNWTSSFHSLCGPC